MVRPIGAKYVDGHYTDILYTVQYEPENLPVYGRFKSSGGTLEEVVKYAKNRRDKTGNLLCK